MATPTLADLLTPVTQEELIDQALQLLGSQGFPTTSWAVGTPDRAILYCITSLIADQVNNLIPLITAGGFTDYATGEWLQFLAQQRYNLAFLPATKTIGNITLYSKAGAPAQTITAGQLICQFPSGNRYFNVNGGSLSSGGSLKLSWQSEYTNDSLSDPPLNYVDGYSPTDPPVLVTALPGVTLLNVPDNYGNVDTSNHVLANGISTGYLALSGTASDYHSFSVIINSQGQVGVATWSYSVDGGAYTAMSTASAVTSNGITITLTNGTIDPSFQLDDTFTFTAPGNWITTQGRDLETDTALRTRCQERWATIGNVNNSSVYDLLAKAASEQVVQTIVQTDGTANNRVNIVIAGQTAALPSGVISDVQTYITARAPICDYPVVYTPGIIDVEIRGNIFINPTVFDAGKAAIQAAVANYMASVGINGTIRLSKIIEVICDQVGVIDATEMFIVTDPDIGTMSTGNVKLGSDTVYQMLNFNQAVADDIVWVFVAKG